MRTISVASVLFGMLLAGEAPAQTTPLVAEGQGKATLVLRADAGKLERLAAEEIQTHLEAMSGAKLPIMTEPPAAGVSIRIGGAVPAEELDAVKKGGADPASFRFRVTAATIDLAGLSEQGTLCAAYELLEQLGVRWFMPGPLGTDVPNSKSVAVRRQDTIQHPGFAGRHLQAVTDAEWTRRLRLGGINAGAHGLGPKFDRKKEPELFMTEKGQTTHQEKVSHPEVLRRVIAHWRQKLAKNPDLKIISVGPHDGPGFGDDPWDATDIDPLMGQTATTDRYVKFFNLVLADLHKDYPDVGLAFYAYTRELRPPVREKPNPRLLPMLAPIGLDRFHSVNNTLSWEKQYLKDVLEGWQATGVKLMYRGYLFNLADQGLPFSMIDQVRHDFPYYHRKGVIGCRVECLPVWAYHGPSLYLAARIFWNPALDADAVLADYFERFYGPAAAPMRRHFGQLENAYIKADYYTGNVFDVPHILTPPVRAELAKSLASAEQAAPADSVYARRVRMVRISFDYGEANFRLMDAYRRCDFAAAKQELDRIRQELLPPATKHTPPLLSERGHAGYLQRFWGRAVEHGHQRITGGNELAVRLPDEWHSFLDPLDSGEALGLWKPALGTQAWRPLKTYSTSTSNQGLRYFKGSYWYRTSATVPAKFKGRPLRLWLGGVDDEAKAWLNGHPLPLLSRGAAPIGLPWEFDATESVRFDAENTLVVKVADRAVNELGTGGLTGPAMIWAAAPEPK